MKEMYDSKMNLTMLTDFYELTMSNGYIMNGFKDTLICFTALFPAPEDLLSCAVLSR